MKRAHPARRDAADGAEAAESQVMAGDLSAQEAAARLLEACNGSGPTIERLPGRHPSLNRSIS